MATKKTTTAAKKSTKASTKAAKEVKEEVKEIAAPAAEVKEEVKAEAKAEVYVEFGGVQVSLDEVVENVKKKFAAENNGEEVKSVKVYLKPQESVAYYVVNDTIENNMDVYFC